MPRSPLRLLVSDLVREPGRRRTVLLQTVVDWALESSRVDPGSPLRAYLDLEGTSGGVLLRGRLGAMARHACRRCLAEWVEPLEVEVLELLGSEADSEYPLAGDEADLEPPLRDAVLLALPLRPLCRPDCRGLCSVCGADLNTNPCGGHAQGPEASFAALRDLLKP